MAGNRIHSRISDELPAEDRREIDRLLIEGATYDDIKAFLEQKGRDISRSAIGRYGKGFLADYKRLKVIEDKSRTLVSEVGEGMVLEEAASKIFAQKIIEAQLEGGFDVLKLPRLVSDFAKLQSSSILRERLKMEFKKRVETVAGEVKKAVKARGLDESQAEEIRRKILGIV